MVDAPMADVPMTDASMTSASEHPMRRITVAKVTLNIGAGKDEAVLKKGLILLGKLSSHPPVKTVAKKRIPAWGLRPGLAIGCKVTLRKNASVVLKRLLSAKENTLLERNFDKSGNVSFGIPEYIDIEGLEYDHELKIMGMEVAVTLERPGYRVKVRHAKPAKVGKRQRITPQEAIRFMQEQFGVQVQ